MAGLGGAFGGLLGNAVLQQIVLFQVVGQLIAPAIVPFSQSVAMEAWKLNPTMPLSPADAAVAVVRNAMTKDAAKAEARLSGVNGDRFDTLSLLAGDAPAPEAMAEALRRGYVNQDRYLAGIRQGRLRDEWAELIKQLAVREPSPEAPLNALLEGQIDEARARELYVKFGGDIDHFQWLFDSQGQAPTPLQAIEMANRGIIGWTGKGPQAVSYEQAFLEGPWRNKWAAPFRTLGEYLPPPRTVVAMLREGSITQARAAELLSKQGLAPDLVQAYIRSASEQKTGGTKDLAQTTILALYHDRIIPKAQALSALQSLGYDVAEAGLILQVSDAQLAQRFLSMAVGRVHARYVGWRVDRTEAVAALTHLELDATGISDLLSLWDIERSTNTAQLTPSQIAKAWHVSVITQEAAISRLKEHGYSDADAWLFLSQYQGSAAANRPAGV